MKHAAFWRQHWLAGLLVVSAWPFSGRGRRLDVKPEAQGGAKVVGHTALFTESQVEAPARQAEARYAIGAALVEALRQCAAIPGTGPAWSDTVPGEPEQGEGTVQ
ncbi:MAG: hypothetical protein KGL73_07080 [Burkholderiales bacterium]|nr:hypothetical protein [Burkholderiales bacterium]